MIFRTSRLLADERITLAQLELEGFKRQLHESGRRRNKQRSLAIDRIYEELQDYQDELFGGVAKSISDLYSRLVKANDAARESPDPAHMKAAADIRNAVDTLVQGCELLLHPVRLRGATQAARPGRLGIRRRCRDLRLRREPAEPVVAGSAAFQVSQAAVNGYRPGAVPGEPFRCGPFRMGRRPGS
jgi:hypothetical protein